MNEIVAALNQLDASILAWRIIVWVSAAYLIGLGILALVSPRYVRRFLEGFASSKRANTLESILRFIAGLGLVGASPEMRLSEAFFWFGVVLIATAIPMVFLYDLHRRYAGWAIPFAKRILPLFGVMAIVLGIILVWAII